MHSTRQQQTLARPVAVSGRGYWSGREVRVEFRPAAPGTGRVFVRDDLGPGARVPATLDSRVPAERRTVLSRGGATLEMVEHALAALAGLGVDNCEVGVNAPELPGLDGSSLEYVQAIESVGLVEQWPLAQPISITRPVRCGGGEHWIEGRPSIGGGLTIEYRLDYGPSTSIGVQWVLAELEPAAFRDDLAPARTFLLKAEADALLAQGLGGHVSPRDLLIFGVKGPIANPLRYVDECARHKVLDVVGDLALAGAPLVGHVVAHRSGHQLNADLVAAVLAMARDSQAPGAAA